MHPSLFHLNIDLSAERALCILDKSTIHSKVTLNYCVAISHIESQTM